MYSARFFSLLGTALLLGSTATRAQAPETLTVQVPKGDKVAVRVPAGWQQIVAQPQPELPPTVKLASKDNAVLLHVTFVPDLEGRFATQESTDRATTEANQRFAESSVEKRNTLTQLVSKRVRGSYGTYTDASLVGVTTLQPGQYRVVTSGVFVLNKQICGFSLLSNDTTSAEYRQAMEIITDGLSAE